MDSRKGLISMPDTLIKLPENRCYFCGKREATLLCDKVKGEIRAIDVGGPGVLSSGIITCDKPICEKCATHIDGADYCPDCVEKLKNNIRRR
ncbi:hypothetical protein SAMN02983006_00181 [Halanaerobium salsuginis]|uniref:Uncharacterized protein n=2 Tax=Halanaerobium salsuginis TaxID=29563 RepID=A0A1I4EW35_9FIRM|nr:hypothetical protein SAMN02983006_00181 [Halanaerobium salsuginis]